MRRRYRAQNFIQFERFCYWRKTVLKIRERILDSFSVAHYLKSLSNSSRCENHRFCKIWVMFCRLKLGPQDSLLSQVFLHSSTRCHFTERRGRGVMFLLGLVCEHLINVNNCCYGVAMEKVAYCWLDFLNLAAGNRLRLFQDSIPKCLKFTILLFKVIPFNCITHPFCASFLAWLARASSELYRFSMKAELFREINGRFLLNELGDPFFNT